MAENPPLTTGPNGEVLPARFEGEMFVLKRHGVEIELNGLHPSNGKWKAKGFLCLSTVRLVFIANGGGDSVGLTSFDIPLAYIHKDGVKQPILGCNHLFGLVWPAVTGGGPQGIYPPIKFKLYFTSNGIGTFLRMYFRVLHEIRTSLRQSQQPEEPIEQKHPSADPDFASTAFVDPNDPSTLFLTQPIPDSSTIPGPHYDSVCRLPFV